VTVFDGDEVALLPTSLLAIAVQLTGVPLLSPVTISGDAAPDTDWPPHVTLNPLAGPPLPTPALKAILTCALPRIARRFTGASGTVAGVTLFDGADTALLPTALVAITLHVTATPFVNPPTTIGAAIPGID